MAKLLSESAIPVHRHHEWFEPEEDDDVIIRSVAERGCILVCGDKNIERDHLFEIWQACAKVILFTDNNSGPRRWTGILALHYEKIAKRVSEAGGEAIIVRVGKAGISKVRTHADIEERLRRLQDAEIQRQKRGQSAGARTAERAAKPQRPPSR